MVNVPASYQPFVTQAAQGTGLPASVVAAQANAESGFNANAVSSTGAEGWLQFEPSTYAPIASTVGVPTNSEFNVADETKVYIKFMNSLLAQEGGNVFRALEAYNAGPGNLAAGASYANGILQNAGQSQSLSVKPGSGTTTQQAVTTGFNPLDPFGIGSAISGGINNAVGGAISSVGNSLIQSFFSALGIPSLKDLFQRLGLILLGVALILVGISIVTKVQPMDVAKKAAGAGAVIA